MEHRDRSNTDAGLIVPVILAVENGSWPTRICRLLDRPRAESDELPPDAAEAVQALALSRQEVGDLLLDETRRILGGESGAFAYFITPTRSQLIVCAITGRAAWIAAPFSEVVSWRASYQREPSGRYAVAIFGFVADCVLSLTVETADGPKVPHLASGAFFFESGYPAIDPFPLTRLIAETSEGTIPFEVG